MDSLLLSTAYAPPLEYMALLYTREAEPVYIEAHEHIVKQSWRNRCDILTANGVQSLTIPIERPLGGKTPIKEVRISEHGSWRHLHEYALRSSYGSSPYFEFYWDDILPFYQRRYDFLWDFNRDLLSTICRLIGLEVELVETTDFAVPTEHNSLDYRYRLHPRLLDRASLTEDYPRYYQPFAHKNGFMPELSVYDLLMNKGPESLLYLRDYAKAYQL